MVETTPKHLIIASIVSAIVLLSFLYMMTQFNNDSGNFNDSTGLFVNLTSKSNTYYYNINTTSGDLQNKIQNASTETGVLGALNGLIQTAWGGLKSIFTSLTFITDFGKFAFVVLKLPTFFIVLVGAIITVIIVFSIWSAIFQKEF